MFTKLKHITMDSSTTVNQDKLQRYMVNFNPMADRFMVKRQFDLVYTMQSMVPVCDKRYRIYNRFRHFWAEIKKLWNYPFY